MVDDFVDNGVIGVRFRQVPDGNTVDASEVKALIEAAGRTVVGRRVAMFESFVREMQVGDVVFMPDTSRGDIVIGEIAENYQYLEDLDVEQCRHRRAVDWKVRVENSSLPASHEHLFKQRVTLKEVEGDDLAQFVKEAFASDSARLPSDRPPVRPVRTSTSTREVPIDHRAADLLCPDCFLRKHPSQFEAGSTICVDCA